MVIFFAQVDTLERTSSPAALSGFRRWDNSRLPVNRPPPEILIVIAAYLIAADPSGYQTLIYLTHVCHLWRQIITAYPTFWTRIRFGGKDMSGSLANVFFQRAKGCNMDVHVSLQPALRRRRPISLSPRNLIIPKLLPGQRIRTLSVWSHSWDGIQNLIGEWADVLFPLKELALDVNDEPGRLPHSNVSVGETLKSLKLTGFAILGLSHIRAPNLTVLELLDPSPVHCSVNALLDFFDITPCLEDVHVSSSGSYNFPPSYRKATLSHVRRITLDMEGAPQIASQLICPSVVATRLAEALPGDSDTDIFPQTLLPLLGSYSVDAIDKVLIRVWDREAQQLCSLCFGAPSSATFHLTCKVPSPPDDVWHFPEVFDQAVSTLLSLPLGQVVMFVIDIRAPSDPAGDPNYIRTRLAEVFEKCSSLQEVVLTSYSPRGFPDFLREKMPPIQTLTITHPEDVSWEELVENVTEVARVRHSKGNPLNRVKIISSEEHPRIEQLESLVKEVAYL